uniref:Helitron helicase-like domain-containing protein n=1 Tax=Romanomermis culicivorax TaxID=13658 RepID=A0A915KCU8_ROMCU
MSKKKLGGNIKVPNFNILIYQQKVLNVLHQILLRLYPIYELVENLLLAVVEEPKAEPIVVDMTATQDLIINEPIDKSKINSTNADEPKINTGTKVAKSFHTCQKKHPGKFCGSRQVGHTVEYFDSGEFKHKCMHCEARMLRSKFFGRASRCCDKGQVNLTELCNILQHPPQEMLDMCDSDNSLAKSFMNNARKYNSELAFGSIHTTKEKAPTERGQHICKIIGETTYSLSDLYAKNGKRPVFGQYYSLEPKIGGAHRTMSAQEKKLNLKIVELFENMLRKHNVLTKAYFFASEIHREKEQQCIANNEPFPKFVMTLLTNCEAKQLHTDNGEIHKHRTDLPTVEQVAVVWLSKDGEPPQFKGVRLYGRQGDYYEMLYFEPNVDPACYPLLFPYGTQGYRYGIEKFNPKDPKFQNELMKKITAGKGAALSIQTKMRSFWMISKMSRTTGWMMLSKVQASIHSFQRENFITTFFNFEWMTSSPTIGSGRSVHWLNFLL